MAAGEQRHHHRSTTKVGHKPFKSKHLSKGAIKDRAKGKAVDTLERGSRRTPQQQVMSKLDRRNRAKQKRLASNAELTRATSIFSGKDGAARHVIVVPLSSAVSCRDAVEALLRSVDVQDLVPESGSLLADIARFKKQKLRFLSAADRDVWRTLDLCRIADYVLLVMSADEEVDSLGENILRTVEKQGVSTVVTLVQGLAKVGPSKKQHQVQASLKSYATHFFPTQEKVHSLDNAQDCSNVVRTLCSTTPKGIKWREDRSWLLIEDIRWPEGEPQCFCVTGVVRGRGLKADRIAQVGDWGSFQIDKIIAAPPESTKRSQRSDGDDAQMTDTILDEPSNDADDLAELAPEEVVMQDVDTATSTARSERRGVLLDDHHYFEDPEDDKPQPPKRIPRGTSKYQAAWYLGDVSDSGSDLEDYEEEDPNGDVDANGESLPEGSVADPDQIRIEVTEGAPSEYPTSEMFLDPSPEEEAEQVAAHRANRKKEAQDDLEFPDEIELHPNVLARERLARYRGLKSLRTSTWDTEEDKAHEPAEWPRLLDIANYKAAKNRYINEALAGGVPPGTRVEVHLRLNDHSPSSTTRETLRSSPSPPVGLFSLLRHEQKRTVCNYSITLDPDYPTPLKSKSRLVMQLGPRRMLVEPVFFSKPAGATTSPNGGGGVRKFARHLHPGQTLDAAVVAPLTWGSLPVLFFRHTSAATGHTNSSEDLEFLATGTSLPPSPPASSSTGSVIAKRAVLTGHPYKIHRRLVTVRYMFFHREDVEWFRALQLWTRRGRTGFIKEALGTHGYFKATFDGPINPLDAVAVSLYKRVWPRWALPYVPEPPTPLPLPPQEVANHDENMDHAGT